MPFIFLSLFAERHPSAAAEERAKARFGAVRWMGWFGVTIELFWILG